MKVLHLQIRNDGCIRAMLNEVNGTHVMPQNLGLITSEVGAKAFYERLFLREKIDSICVRVYTRGEGWVNPQRINQ